MAMLTASRLAGAGLIAALVTGGAFAQQPPPRPAQPPAGQPAPAQPAPAQAQGAAPIFMQPTSRPGESTIAIPDANPTHLAACREVVVRSGLTRSFDQAILDIARQIQANTTRTRPELTNDLKATLEGLFPEFGKLTEDMIVNGTRIYTALMTEAECRDTANYFKSPIGAKFVEIQPVVFGNLADVLDPWRRFLSSRMFEMTRDEMKKKGHSI